MITRDLLVGGSRWHRIPRRRRIKGCRLTRFTDTAEFPGRFHITTVVWKSGKIRSLNFWLLDGVYVAVLGHFNA
jgi:hypothetical protein